MAKHQIIYTSCMRGIDGVNDGQQVFSYDESFNEIKTDEIKSLFTYQVPSLPSGVLMSEEIAATMPTSFIYRRLKNGSVSLTLNTYLGRDYMGSTGRFGNHLSHSIVGNFSDFDVYPCEMYGSTALRSSMSYEEVNNPDIPAYLPTPELTRGYVIEPDSIIEFLGIEDNLDYYKKMFTAMLKFSTKKKRIIICDEPENIAKWIAALHYALPLDIAKKINFSTYEYDPELSPSQICGVISEGSKYNVMDYVTSNRHYVFDFINNKFTNIENESVFVEFLDVAFSYSYESLLEFHEFVMSKTTYRDYDKKYLASYHLYNLLSEGIEDTSMDEFASIVSFADEYLTDEVKQQLLNKLFEDQYSINQLDYEYALLVLGYMLKSLDSMDLTQQQAVKQMIVDRLIFTLSTPGIGKTEFLPLYNNIDDMARTVSLSLPAELMRQPNRDSLLDVLSQNIELWKVHFVVRIISDYVKDMHVSTDELYPNRSIGAIYFGLVQMAYKTSRHNGHEIVEKILEGFNTHAEYFVNMTLNIEGFLNDLNLAESDIEHLWNYFSDYVLGMESADIDAINYCLEDCKRYDEMYMLYDIKISSISRFEDANDYFGGYWNKWFKYEEYGQVYAAKALKKYVEVYKKKLLEISEKEKFSYACEILDIAMKMEIKDDYVDVLIQQVCEFIPLEKLDNDNKKLIIEVYRYNIEVLQKEIEGRLLLFLIAIQLNKVTRKASFITIIDKINMISVDTGAKLSGLEEKELYNYFEWAFDLISKISLSTENFVDLHKLFQFSKRTQTAFMEYWCKLTYKNSKKDKDYSDFGEFLAFMFRIGNINDQEMVGKFLCKLSKQKLEDLDEEMRTYFKRDRKSAHAWGNVLEIASSTSPLLNNLSNLFKKK